MRVFVDTNVLVYAADTSAPEKQRRAMDWMDTLWRSRTGRISVQVVKEFYSTVTRKLKPGLPAERAQEEIRKLWTWNPITTDLPLFERTWTAEARFGFSFWDAMIVAAAHAANCKILLTEDLQDGQDLDGLRVIDPFSHEPADIVASG